MKFIQPKYFRQFNLAAKGISFGKLSPLHSGDDWSAVSIINLSEKRAYSPIVSKRTNFASGSNQFTFWLKNGRVSVEADADGRGSDLEIPLNTWAIVAAAASAEEVHLYLGVEGIVTCCKRTGLSVGAGGAELPLVVGRLDGNFPGAIATVCLYKEKLSDATLRSICSGIIRPEKVPGLAFAWVASSSESDDKDLVSGSPAEGNGEVGDTENNKSFNVETENTNKSDVKAEKIPTGRGRLKNALRSLFSADAKDKVKQ
jgi:hypothetical protein